MHCLRCRHSKTRTYDTRPHGAGDEVRRRRECAACGFKFTTIETQSLSRYNTTFLLGRILDRVEKLRFGLAADVKQAMKGN